MTIVLLAITALLTATLSAIIGMGGGILLLATMFCFLSHSETIPTHAAVQLVSNSTRVLAFLKHVDWRTVTRFWCGALPGAMLGVWLLTSFGPPDAVDPWLKTAVGAYILLSLLLPKPSGRPGQRIWWDWPMLGLVAGTAALTVGAVGPLIAPLFARRDFVKERLIATKAVCQMSLHLGKIPAFLLIREIDLTHLGTLAVVMAAMAIPGTLLGKRLVTRVSERQFVRIYRAALALAGFKVLLADGIWPLVRP